MKTKIFICLLLLTNSTFAQKTELVKLKNTEQFVLESELYENEPFTIQVCLPRNYDNNKKYPVIYLLDADQSIGIAKEVADWLTFNEFVFKREINDVIIVGIAYHQNDSVWFYNRVRDFVPPTKDTIGGFDKYWQQWAGGADTFLNFIEEDLKPEIKKRYSVSENNDGIVGHSFGGLLAAYALVTRSYMFNNYIIIAPALIWDNKLVERKENEYFKNNNELNRTVYFALTQNDSEKVINKPTREFIEKLKSRNYKNLQLYTKYFNEGTHLSFFPNAFTIGLKTCYKK